MRRQIRFVIDLSNRYSPNPMVDFFITWVINTAIIVALLGNLDFVRYQSILDFVVYGTLLSLFDRIFRDLMLRYQAGFILQTFGLVMLIPAVLSLSIAYGLMLDVIRFDSTDQFLGFVVIFLGIRKALSLGILTQLYRRKMLKMKKARGKSNA